MYYKKHNSEWYDENETNITDIKFKERILLKCIKCKNTYSEAYKCKECDCPLYEAKTKWMKKPHTCSDWFLNNRQNFHYLDK